MKKLALFLLAIAFGHNSYSQISFEKGYYIDNSGLKHECLIKNGDWKNNPTEFEFKDAENANKKATIKSVQEFGIYNQFKFEKHRVNIDRSSETINSLSNNKNPKFQEEELFLKVLMEGDADLFEYTEGNLKRYFFKKDDLGPEQLIYKSYVISQGKIGKNERYKQQLWTALKCPAITMKKVEGLDYNKRELLNFFVDYNECSNKEYLNYEDKEKKDLFNLSIRPGLNMSSLSINNDVSNSTDTDFGNEFGFRFGIEGEFIMPFANNKWAVIVEPTYQYYKTEKEVVNPSATVDQSAKVDYTSIELPVGIRYFFFAGSDSKVFVNGAMVIDFNLDSSIEFDFSKDLELKSRVNYALGVGYRYMDKYGIELRYLTGREVLSNYLNWNSNYNTLSLVFGYSFF
jgi:hypothetical protein